MCRRFSDDLVISPDFFQYFQATFPLLVQDESLFCVSAWNDNGLEVLVNKSEAQLLHRTDFFPGKEIQWSNMVILFLKPFIAHNQFASQKNRFNCPMNRK